MSEGNGNVSYSVKELLAKLDGKIDGLFMALGSKADKEELVELEKQVAELKLEAARSGGGREWAWRVAIAAPGLASLIAIFYH